MNWRSSSHNGFLFGNGTLGSVSSAQCSGAAGGTLEFCQGTQSLQA